jgi:EAL and modified HD-GYP domain-containing signal transduction protein
MTAFVARQPILDREEKLFAYELLFRAGPENFFPASVDGDHASSKILHDSLHTFGLDRLAGRHPVFINLTRHLLVQQLFTVLPKERVVIELLETIEPDEHVLRACRVLRAGGYSLALDDFIFAPKYEPLLRLATIVKIDFRATTGDARREVADRLAPFGLELLAEKVETHEDFRQGLALGYRYFQGYYFCKPEMISEREVPRFKIHYLNLFTALHQPDFDLERILGILRLDPSLSLKLLRYLNSAFFGWDREIASLRHAITLLGETSFRRWAAVVLLAGMGNDRADELLDLCLVRARFCEQLAAKVAGAPSMEYFLLGMLSMLDALIGRPLPELLAPLPLLAAMRASLLELDEGKATSKPAQVLALAQAYERGHWEAIDAQSHTLGLAPALCQQLYEEATGWAHTALGGG